MNTIISGRWNRHSSDHEETKALRVTRERHDNGKASAEELAAAQDAVIARLVRALEETGVSMISDGGIRWDSIYDVARNIGGVSGFSRLTRIPDTNNFHRQPVATFPLRLTRPLLRHDLEFLKERTKRPVVLSLPGPYSLACQTQNANDIGFARLAFQYAAVLGAEIRRLTREGADLIRIEEPLILHHPERFDLFKVLMVHLTTQTDISRTALATWYRPITGLPGYFDLPFGTFFVDFVEAPQNVEALKNFPTNKRLVAGIMDARQTYRESFEELADRVLQVEQYVPRERIALSPNTDLHFLPWNEALEKACHLAAFAQWYPTRVPEAAAHQMQAYARQPALVTAPVAAQEAPQAPRLHLPQIAFPTSAVGSYPQHPEMREARVALRKGQIEEAKYRKVIEAHTRRWMAYQNHINLTVPVGGEFLREDMAVYFSEAFGGKKLDFVPSYENRRYRPIEFSGNINPLEASLLVNDFRYLQSLTTRPVKETITGPATLADWALLRHPRYYGGRRALRMDIARALNTEIGFLVNAGVRVLQVDEPALTTKMDVFPIDVEAIAETIRGYEDRLYLVLHICYSDMTALDAAWPSILSLPFHQIHMEMANREYALLEIIKKHGFGDKDIGLGVLDVHTDRVETVDEIVAGVERTLPYFSSPNRIWLTPDCGLKERSDSVSQAKLIAMCEAAKICREKFGK